MGIVDASSTNDADIHTFALIGSGVSDPDSHPEEGIFEAGCDDAVLAFRNGVGYIEFDRRGRVLT